MKSEFSAREVAVLVEDLKSEFHTVVEIVAPLPERLSAVEVRLEKVEVRLASLEGAFRTVIPDLTRRVSRLETKSASDFLSLRHVQSNSLDHRL